MSNKVEPQSLPTYPSHDSNADIPSTSATDDIPRGANPVVPTEEIYSPPLFVPTVCCSFIFLYEHFITLECTCIDAASRDWHTETHDPGTILCSSQSPQRIRRHAFSPLSRIRMAMKSGPPLQLMDYLQRISQMICDRSITSGSHAEILNTIYRIGNLYT